MLLRETGVLTDLHRPRTVVREDVLREEHSAHIVVNEVLLHLFAVKERDYFIRALDAEGSQHHGDGNFLTVIDLNGARSYSIHAPRSGISFATKVSCPGIPRSAL